MVRQTSIGRSKAFVAYGLPVNRFGSWHPTMPVSAARSTGIPYNPAVLPAPPPGCPLTLDANGKISADCDNDGDVDQGDFGILQRVLSRQ
jgi:hypothetical protein